MSSIKIFDYSRTLPSPFDTLKSKKIKVSSTYGDGTEATLSGSVIKAVHSMIRYMKDGLISKEDYMDIKAQYDERIASQKQAYDQAQKEIDMYLDDNSKPHQWIQDFMEHRNITELTRMVAVECIDEIAIYEDRKIEVSFTHWQDYSALSEQVREYYQENHKEVV